MTNRAITPLRAIDLAETDTNLPIQSWFYTDNDMRGYLCSVQAYAHESGQIINSDGTIIGIWYFMDLSAKFPTNAEEKARLSSAEEDAMFLDELEKACLCSGDGECPQGETPPDVKTAAMEAFMASCVPACPCIGEPDHRCTSSDGDCGNCGLAEHEDETEAARADDAAEWAEDRRRADDDDAKALEKFICPSCGTINPQDHNPLCAYGRAR